MVRPGIIVGDSRTGENDDFSDYRDVDGIKLPFKTVNNNIANGNISSEVILGSRVNARKKA